MVMTSNGDMMSNGDDEQGWCPFFIPSLIQNNNQNIKTRAYGNQPVWEPTSMETNQHGNQYGNQPVWEPICEPISMGTNHNQ